MIRFRPLPVMSLLSLIALGVLVMLGGWQWQRFEEKMALKAAPAVAASLGPVVDMPGASNPPVLYGVWAGVAGWRVLQPVRVGAAPDIKTYLVDAGFIPGVAPPPPDARQAAVRFQAGQTLTGYWAIPGAGDAFTATPDIKNGAFYAFNAPALIAFSDLTALEPQILLTPYKTPQGQSVPNPFSLAADPLSPERHFGYALTWWGLALTLIGVYLAFHARAGRLGFGRA
jgi:surfeit locus 1 family protein